MKFTEKKESERHDLTQSRIDLASFLPFHVCIWMTEFISISRPREQMKTLTHGMTHKLCIQSQCDKEMYHGATDVKVTALAAQPFYSTQHTQLSRTHKSEKKGIFHSQIRSQSSDKGTHKGQTSLININCCPRAKSSCTHQLHPSGTVSHQTSIPQLGQ